MSKAHEQYQAGEEALVTAAQLAADGPPMARAQYFLSKARTHFAAAQAAAQIHTAGYAASQAQFGGQR